MALARRRAEVGWRGTLEEGRGSFSVGSWMLGEVPVTWASRTSPKEESTSPEELMAASHASCYAMALSLVLGERGTPPESISVAAECTLDETPEGFGITSMDLGVAARSPASTPKGSAMPPGTPTASAPSPKPSRATSTSRWRRRSKIKTGHPGVGSTA